MYVQYSQWDPKHTKKLVRVEDVYQPYTGDTGRPSYLDQEGTTSPTELLDYSLQRSPLDYSSTEMALKITHRSSNHFG